jgi:hypothetical protein
MDNLIFWLIIIGGILSPLLFSARAIRNLFLGWRIPITRISALPSKGWVEVIGRVKGEPITSLLSNSECAYWQLEVKEHQSGGRGGGRWRTIYKNTSGAFEVDDMTGKIQIQDEGADFVLNNETTLNHLDDQIKAKLENLGVKTRGFLGFNKKLRVHERLIDPGEEIIVLGKVLKSEGLISGGSINPLLISNMTKAEMLKKYIWQIARIMIIPFLIGLAFLGFYLYTMLQ